MSGDPTLVNVLRSAGRSGDAFSLIAATWLRGVAAAGGAAQPEERERAKRVTYGA